MALFFMLSGEKNAEMFSYLKEKQYFCARFRYINIMSNVIN